MTAHPQGGLHASSSARPGAGVRPQCMHARDRLKKYSATALRNKFLRPENRTNYLMNNSINAPKPPKHLRKPTQKWFKSVAEDYELDGHHIKLLTLAAEAWDQSQAAREVLDRDGLTFLDRFGQPKERPECGILQNARIAFARLIRELALDVDTPADSRPPRTREYR